MSTGKLAIGGLKVSLPQAQIIMHAGAGFSAAQVFRLLAQRRINMTLVAMESNQGRPSGTCCIDLDDLAAAEALLDRRRGGLEIIAPVAVITIYPHRWHLLLLEAVLWAWARSGLNWYACASSISALSLTTDYGRLEEAVEAIATVAVLPPDHAPISPGMKVRQI